MSRAPLNMALEVTVLHRLAVVALCSVGTVAYAEPSCVITDFGIVEEAHEVMAKPSVGAASGQERYVVQAHIKERTDRIPARLGVRFGVKHSFTDVTRLAWSVIHPPMRTASGDLKTISRGQKNPRDVGSFLGFDKPNEVLPGQWTFRFESNGKLLCEKIFTVYAE